MGLALTLFSFGTVAGPAKGPAECVWDAAQAAFVHVTDRARQYGETIRFVYTLEHRLQTLEEEQNRACQPRPSSCPRC
jgi:hypothetical protein